MGENFQFRSLAQAQKKYPDAIQARLTHDAYCMTIPNIIEIGKSIGWKEEARVLFYKIGKCVSKVIVSRMAQVEYEQKFERWLKAQNGKGDVNTLREIFDAMDDNDK